MKSGNENISFGTSKESVKNKEILDQLAQGKLSLLISGESGVGKNFYADYFFSKIEEPKKFRLIDSSLLKEFNFEKIFSYKYSNEIFYLCIDRIETLAAESQAFLLQKIEENRRASNSLRFIFLANENMEEMVRQKKFMEELYFRINSINVHISPLRKKKEDISFLLNHFISKFLPSDKKIKKIDEEFKNFLFQYHWPGNVREFENFIQRITYFLKDEVLGGKDVPAEYFDSNKIPAFVGPEIIPGLKLSLYEKEIIRKNLEYVNWNRKKASEILGISERTLYRKLKELKINE